VGKFKQCGGFMLLLFGLCGAGLAQEAQKSSFATRQCKCLCGTETMQLDFADAQACEQNTGSVCEQASGTRAKLSECSLLFVNPKAPQAPASVPAAQPAIEVQTPVAAHQTASTSNPTCQAGESSPECSARLQDIQQKQVDKKMEDTQNSLEENLQDLLLGASEVSGAGVREDFLRRFLLGLDFPGLSEDDGLLSFRYNTPGGALGFEAHANKPILFEKLKEAIPEADRESKAADLDKTLGDFDDISFSLKVNLRPTNTRLGRNLETYTEPAGMLLKEAKKEATRVAAFGVSSARAFESRIEELGFYSLADLAANQPQFSFQLTGRQRADLIGPDKIEASLVWELGLGANLNMLQKELAESRCQADKVGCIQAFLADADDAVERKWRLSFKAAYSETDAYDSPIEGVDFHLDKAQSLIASATWGGVLSYSKAADGKTIENNTFALEGNYEDVTGDEERQNRFVATATFTQHLTDDMSFQLTAVWANKPEYRGEVDKALGARAGIRYKFNRPPATQGSGN